jgi:2-polyprenyl-3-methyl-5-hydroxy-6-metoxy-1,4-benzoquinol methylase
MPEPSSVQRYFGRRAATYHRDASRGLWRRLRTRETRAVMAALAPRAGEEILDAGCGAGHYAEVIAHAGARVTALDASAPMLQALRQRLAVETIHADLESVRLQPRFDRIACLGVLEFVPDPARVLANLAAGLRRGGPGLIVVLVPGRSWGGRLYRAFHRRHGVAVRLFGPRDLEAMGAAAGLRLQSTARVTFNLVASLRLAEA